MTDNKIPIFSEELAKANQQAEQATQDASATPLPSDTENTTETAPYNFTQTPSVASTEASEGEKSDIVPPMLPNGEEPGDVATPIVEATQPTQPNTDVKPKASTPKAKPVKYPIAYNDDDLQKAYSLLTDDEKQGINLDTDEGKASMSAMVDRLKLPNRIVVGADGKQQRVYLPYDPDDTSSEAYTQSQKPIEVIGTEGKRGGEKLGIPLAEIMDNPSSVRWKFGDTTITGMQPITGGVTQAKVKDLESASYTSDGKPILTFKTQDGTTQKVILNATKADVDKARSERNAVAEVDLRSKEALLQARQSDIDAQLSKAMHDEGYTTPDVTQGVDDGNSLSSLVRLYLLPRINPKTAPLANAYDTNKATLDKIEAIKTNITNGNTSSGMIDDVLKSGSEVLGGFLSKVSKASTWDNGVSELSLATYGKKAYDKYMAGGKLTDDEQAMLDAIGYSLYFDEMYKDNLHNANLGAGVAESLPYAINIAIAGWTGAGKAVGNATETAITKALKSRLLKRYGETAIARWLPSIASKATSALTEAGVATGVGGLKQEADALSRMTGDVDTSSLDATGHATYNKDSNVDGGGIAHYKAFGAGLIENLSEMAEPYLAMIPRGIKSVVSNKMATLAKKNGTFNTLYDAMASLKPSQLSQVLDAGLRKGKINGLFEEVAGEVAGNIANAALIGDMSFTIDTDSPEWQNSVFNPEVNADIVAQCAIMSYGFRVPGAIADATYNANRMASSIKTNIMGKKAFGDKWTDIKATIDAMSPEDAVGFASNAVKEQSDGCEAVYRYAIQSKGEQLANNINANKDDNANDITDVAHDTAVKAVDAPIAEARQAVKVANESSQEMPNSLKVSIDALVDNDASDGEVKSLFDQLSDAERPLAEQYYLAQVKLKGHEVGATARADAETEQFADAVSDMSTEVDGNAVVMTADVGGEQKVIKSKGDTMTILADGTAVTSDKVTDVKTSPIEDIVESHRSQALKSEMDKLDFAKSHNPNTINPNSGDVVMGADGKQYVYNESVATNSDGSQVTQTCLYPAIPSEDGGIVADTSQPLLQGISRDEVLSMQDRYYDGLDNNATQDTTRNEETTDATDTQETTESVEDNTTNDTNTNDGQQTDESVDTPNEEQSIDQGNNQTEVSTEQENNTDNAQPKDVNVTDASKIADTYVSKISKARASKSDSVRRNADKLVSAFTKKAKASSSTDLGAMVSRLASQTDNDTAIELLDIANNELQSRKSARRGKANEAPQSDNDVQATEATQTTEAIESPTTEEANSHLAESEQKAKERMKYLTPSQVARLMRIGKVAKSMGLGIRFIDTMADNGLYDPNTNTITIALDAENPIEVVFGHEVTHGLRNQSEEAYQSLRNAVMATIPSDAFKTRVASTKSLYESAGQKGNDEYYEEEAICDLVGEMVGKSDILSNLKRNADYKVLGWMHSVAKSIMGVLRRGDNEYQKFSEAEKAFRQAYLDAVNRESYMDAGGYFEDDMSKVPIRSSVRSITTGIGLKPVKDDGNGNFVLVGNDGKKFDSEHPVTAEYLDKISQYDENRQCSPMAYLIHDALTEGHIDKSDLPSVFKTYADILNLYLNIGKNEYGGFDNLSDTFLWLGDSVYKTVATNSDTQYKLSLDITRVCKKNEAVIRAISEMQRREGYGITPGQILEIYEASNKAGYQVPCPVCYVFTRYIRNGQFATIMINGQRKYGHILKNPDTMTDSEKSDAIEFWKTELAMVEAENASNKNAIKSAKEDIVTIQTEINNLAKIITDPANHNASEISKAKKKVTELDKRYRAALDVVSQSSLDSWIRIFAISEHNGKFSLVRDSYKGFPDEVALDLRLTSLAKREYPAIQRFRNSRGSGAGKEITFESDNAIGDVALGLSSKGHAEMLAEAGDFTNEEKEILKEQYGEDYEKMLGRKNYYLLASECSDSKIRRKILNDASKAFNKARVYLEQQTLRGGQRMWSWSDNIESLSPDVVINLMQLQMLGGGLQTYSKQLEGIAMVASLGGYVNGSLMGKGNGVREVSEEDVYLHEGREYMKGYDYRTTDSNGNEITLRAPIFNDNGKRFVLEFDNVVGVEPFGHDGKKGLFDLNSTMDKAGNILVGMNDTHIRTAMADDRIFFIIPWHSSGANNHVLSQMYRILQVKYSREESTDYTNMQSDKFVDEGGKYPKGLSDYFESHKRDDIPCAFGNIESSSEEGESLSESQIKYRRLREYALLGYPTEGKGGNAVRVDVSNYPELMEEINKDYFLNKVYNTIHERVSTQSMTPDDITHIYPYEYWLTDSTLDNADENTAYYIEYCRRLGVKPKFCGSLPGTGHGNFLDDKGAWKLLIDRRMYDTNGNYQDIDSVSVKGFSTDLIDPRETAKKYDITKVADKSATGEIVSDVMEKEKRILGKNLSVNYDTNLNDAVAIYNKIKSSLTEQNNKNERKSVRKDVAKEMEDIIAKAKADGTYMKAPNGKPSKLSPTQWAIVRTKAFKKWFGDWENDPDNSSKVVDENGEPLVVYHGSKSKDKISIFNEYYEKGMFFSTSKNVGSIYATNEDNLYSVFINSKNPLIVDNKGKDWNKIDAEDLIEAAEKMFGISKEEFLESLGEDRYVTTDGIIAAISRLSEENNSPYDGFILKNVVETWNDEVATDVVAIKSNQIKSATENEGTFDINNKDIRKSLRKDVASETIDDETDNDTSVGELMTRYSVRKKPDPQKTKKAYKLFKVDVNGNPHALFIDKASNLEQGIWYDADCPNIESIQNLDAGYTYLMDMEGVVYDKRSSDSKLKAGEVKEASEKGLRWMSVTEGAKGTKLVRNVGINGSGTVSMYALRPGWHATSAPSARHIGSTDGGKEVKYRRPDERWFEIEISADNDYNDEARERYMASHPKAKRDDVYSNMKGDITDKIPEDGFYNFKTNSNANPKQSWYISGSIRIVRPIGEKEAQQICDKEGVAHDLPYKDGIKNFIDDEQGLTKSAEEAVSAYKEEAERPKPLVSAILHSIRGGKRNVPIDPFVEGWDSIISRDAFKLEETSFDSLKAVEEFQRYMTGSKDVPDYLNAHRALMVLSSVNKAQMDMFAGTYVENLRKSIEEMVGTAEMNKGFYAEDGALAELDRFLKAQHGLERNRDMRVRAKLSEIYNEKIAEAQVAYNQTQDKEAYNDAVKKAQEEYNVALDAFYAKRDEIVAEGLEAGDNWYLINTKLDNYVIETFYKSDKKDTRDLTLAEINALKANRDELLERAKNEQWSARRLQEALNKMLSEENFKFITGNKKMVSLPATKEYYDELAGLTGMFNWGNTPLGVYLANEEAKQFVSWYKDTENKESLDAVEKAIADINDFSLNKQKESGLVDEDYVKEQKRRYLNFVPLRDFMDVSSDDMYDYLTGNEGVGGNPVKTAKGRHSEAGPAIAGLINVANRSITAGNRNLALQKMYNIVKAKGVNTLANARNRWIVRDSEDTNKWHDAEPEIATDATAEQVTTQLEEFENNMKDLEEQGLARRVDGKKMPSEYRIMSRTQMDEHKIKVAIGGRQYIIDFLGNPRAAQAANGMTNPDVSDDAGRTLFRTFKNFLASAFTSKNIAFSVVNFFRDTEHSNNYVFIKEGGEYYRRFTDRQFNKFKYRSYMKEIFSKLKMFREGKLSEDDTFYQFMNNGGATGYTFVQSQEEEAEKFVKELVEAKKGNWGKKMWNRFFDMVEYMGNVSELTNRYIAFLTSREMGRSIGRSIEDAKEVTLNFNRKGSGTKTKIDGLLPQYIPSVVEYGQRYILFFNANVQAKRQLLYMLMENPAKTTGARMARAAFFRMMIPAIFAGVFLPAINDIVLPAIYSALGFDDDDDEGNYDYFNKLGDYERSHSINFALPNNAFLSIPVSPDIAPFMSIGDVISAQMQNKRDMSLKDFIEAGTDIISPININYGSEDDINWTASAMSFFPSQMRPIGDVFVNTNFMGQPVYKGGGIGNRQYTPEYKKGMRRTSPALTAWSKFVNDMSGGDEVEKGAMDGLFNNPAVMEHLLKGYLGGYGTATLDMVINPLYNSLTGDFNDLSLKAEQLPLVGRFYKGGSRNEQMRRMERTFRNEVYERNAETRAQESELKKEAMKANREGQLYRLAELRNKYIQLVQSDKYKKYYATKQASEAISDQLKLTSTMTDNEKRYLIDMMKRTIGIYRGEIKIYGTPSEDNQ